MKAIVLYRSKTGFAEKYARWIAEELRADLRDASRFDAAHLADYDTVVFGGSLHAVGIIGVQLITENMNVLKGKKIAVFATGAAPARQEAVDEVRNSNFTPDQQKELGFFYLRGGFDYSKLPPVDKVLMLLLKWKIKWRKKTGKELSGDEIGMMLAYDKPADFTKKEYINPLLDYLKGQ